MSLILLRVAAVGFGLLLWYLTQMLIGRRLPPTTSESGGIYDGLHHLTRRMNQLLNARPRLADALLISSSLVIDLLGGFLLIRAIWGPTLEPFVGLFLIFALRQVCQAFCPLPPPEGMIWRHPGWPTLLVTYGTTNDLFFSGHTALAVYGCCYLGHELGWIGVILGTVIAAYEITTVLVLRAHYTMDIFAGGMTALWVFSVAGKLAPWIDLHLLQVTGSQ